MFPEQLAFFITFQCNFQCDHCSVDCSPKRKEVLEFDIIKIVLDQAYAIPSLRVAVFTGGEPTLYFNTLCMAVAYATQKGFVTRLITNAWWANTLSEAKKVLGELRRNGLAELNISFDDFHLPYLERYGGEQNVVNAIKTAVDFGMVALIGAVVYPGAKIRTSYLRQMVRQIKNKDILFMEDFFQRLGRARYKLNPNLHFIDETELRQSTGCTDAGRVISITPSGNIYMCCGHSAFAPEAQDVFLLGNINDEKLFSMIQRMRKNVFYWWLHLEGPKEILKAMGMESNERPCEACYSLSTAYRKQLKAMAANKEKIFTKLIGGGENATVPTYPSNVFT